MPVSPRQQQSIRIPRILDQLLCLGETPVRGERSRKKQRDDAPHPCNPAAHGVFHGSTNRAADRREKAPPPFAFCIVALVRREWKTGLDFWFGFVNMRARICAPSWLLIAFAALSCGNGEPSPARPACLPRGRRRRVRSALPARVPGALQPRLRPDVCQRGRRNCHGAERPPGWPRVRRRKRSL